MKVKTVFLWITPAVIAAFLIGLLTAGAVARTADSTFWSDAIEERVRVLVGQQYVDAIPVEKQEELFYAAMEAYLQGLDQYCTFYDPEEREQMEVDTRGQFGGVGILVEPEKKDGGLVVTGVRTGDPAESAGMEIGDLIVSVDGTPVAGLDLDGITALIKGVPGTRVTIGVVRDGKTLDLPMFRSKIKVDSVKGVRIVDAEHGVGYLHVTSFQENTGDDARAALEQLLDEGATSFILDLRQNRGGVLEKGAVALVDLFLDGGPIVKTAGRSESSKRIYEASPETTLCREQPLVVLVDGLSASAAEVVAGAFQDRRRGILVGERTYGKFLVQSIHRLPELNTALSLTTARYYTPYGRWLQRRDREGIRGGLLPDVVVERTEEESVEIARRFSAQHGIGMQVAKEPDAGVDSDPQLRRAVEILGDYAVIAAEKPR